MNCPTLKPKAFLIMKRFRETTGVDLPVTPVTAVIYMHRHPDYSFGSAGLGVT
jgi:hypothetical protein